jgi:integrase
MMNSDKSKRKAAQATREMLSPKANSVPLHIENAVIEINSITLHFKRLKYKGCPNINNKTRTFPKNVDLNDMTRDEFIRDIYQKINDHTPSMSAVTYFRRVIDYVKWLDANDISTDHYLEWTVIDEFMIWCADQEKLGKMKLLKRGSHKANISWLLRKDGRDADAKNLPTIKGIDDEIKGHKSLDLKGELKPVVRALLKAYRVLLSHTNEGTTPEVHPLYNKELVEKMAEKKGLKGRKLAAHRGAFLYRVSLGNTDNYIIKIAMMLTYMFTGINTTPLARMTISDVSFVQLRSGRYIFDSVKARANYQTQDNAMGFSKHSKEFIESWLRVVKKISNGDTNAYLFPYFKKNGDMVSYSSVQVTPYVGMNKLLSKMGLANITPSIFRKTKLDAIFKVTESVYLVSMSGNNSVDVVSKDYSKGVESDHQNNLGASMDATYKIAKGEDIKSSVQDAKFNFADVLSNYDYMRLREGSDRSHESRTPVGVRCKDNTKGSAKRIHNSLMKLGIESSNSENICTDFLGCFECEAHALVADVEDIWLMLSFKDTLQQLQQTPSINSMPEHKYEKLFNTIVSALQRYKEKSLENYNEAEEKIKDSSHPLYSNVYSLNDLLEVYS